MNNELTILTRTHRRPKCFKRLRKSVLKQTVKANHIISIDEDTPYAKGDMIVRVEKTDAPYPMNLYFNEMVKYADGWILHLDDDDILTRKDSLAIMLNHIEDEDSLILWRVDFRNGWIVPGRNFGRFPAKNDIAGGGFLVHSKHWIDWRPVKCGDYYVISEYFKRLHPVWINEILTGLQGAPGSVSKKWDY